MRYSDAFLRTLKDRASIAAYAGAKLSFDKRKSQPQRGDYWACCPFHGEKTPSFHVMEEKGTYKCFGCGEAGGTLDLMMKLEGLTFPEAVERLADFAGVPLPEDAKDDRYDQETKRRSRALAAASAAAALFAEALNAPAGAQARAYLIGRGLSHDTWERFGLGYALEGWTSLIEALSRQGFTLEELVDAGLARAPQDGKRAIDIFRGRITFAIQDPQGRTIAFGGRAIQQDAQAKYINSPDSLIFHKGQTLYRYKQARETLARTQGAKGEAGLVVGEGYMDVIAFERAGLPAVAPLGTALTAEQLALLWKAAPEPTICFDGDAAGQRAAARALALALPLVGPDQTIKIALLAGGEDPDDVFRRAGPEGLAQIVAAARPAVDALFTQEAALRPLTTPEAKAGFKARLKKAAGRIADEDTRTLYLRELLSRADALIKPPLPPRFSPAAAPRQPYSRPAGPQARGMLRFAPPLGPTAAVKASLSAPRDQTFAWIIGAALDHPVLAADHAEDLAAMPVEDDALVLIRDTLLAAAAESESVDRESLIMTLNDMRAVDAAARVPHLPTLALEQKGLQVDRTEAVRMSLAAEEVQAPELLKAPGAIRARVARRGAVRMSVRGDEEAVVTAAIRAEFARVLREAVENGELAQDKAWLHAQSDDDLVARAQAMTFDRLRAARAARDAALDGADD